MPHSRDAQNASLKLEMQVSNARIWGVASLAAIAVLSSCSGSATVNAAASSPPQQSNRQERKLAPDFTLTDANGTPVKLSDYRGKVVILNFWATWCGPCRIEIPWFEEFEQEYKSKGLEIIGVAMDDDGWSAIKPYIAEHKMNYRVLLGNDSVSQLYGGVDAMPTTFMIGRDGRFAFEPHIGLAGKDEYLSEIQSLLGIKQTNASRRVMPDLPAVLFPRAAE